MAGHAHDIPDSPDAAAGIRAAHEVFSLFSRLPTIECSCGNGKLFAVVQPFFLGASQPRNIVGLARRVVVGTPYESIDTRVERYDGSHVLLAYVCGGCARFVAPFDSQPYADIWRQDSRANSALRTAVDISDRHYSASELCDFCLTYRHPPMMNSLYPGNPCSFCLPGAEWATVFCIRCLGSDTPYPYMEATMNYVRQHFVYFLVTQDPRWMSCLLATSSPRPVVTPSPRPPSTRPLSGHPTPDPPPAVSSTPDPTTSALPQPPRRPRNRSLFPTVTPSEEEARLETFMRTREMVGRSTPTQS